MTLELIDKAQRMYDSRNFTMAEIAQSCRVTPMTIYRNIRVLRGALSVTFVCPAVRAPDPEGGGPTEMR
ncbi:MAG: hypothetical protein M0005_01880 [Actinomycetota bacterium]|nr:hypothetical protein [Actinomycetota bacterium]